MDRMDLPRNLDEIECLETPRKGKLERREYEKCAEVKSVKKMGLKARSCRVRCWVAKVVGGKQEGPISGERSGKLQLPSEKFLKKEPIFPDLNLKRKFT
jgi:hypothetical protein